MTGRAVTDQGRFMQGRRPTKRAPLKVGRVTKLTPDISKKITDAVRAGNAASVAARYAGVAEGTFQEWIARGRGEHSRMGPTRQYTEFANDVAEAQAAAEVAAVLHWRSAMPKDWHAAKDWLKVTQPDRWDPDRDKMLTQGAIAAVQVNIGTGNAQSGPQVHDMPLEHLIEDSPAFLKAVMPLFDVVDAVYGGNDPDEALNVENARNDAFQRQNDASSALTVQHAPYDAESAPNAQIGAVDAVYDATEGTWRVIDTETGETVEDDA